MRIRQAGLKRQSRGITMFGILIGIIVLITAVLPAIRSIPSLMEYQNTAVTMGAKDADEYARKETDSTVVAEIVRKMAECVV